MSNQSDPRIAELLDLAREEGITLPYPAHYICWLEDKGRIVDLVTGKVYNGIVATPTSSARAVAYLLGHEVGAVAI